MGSVRALKSMGNDHVEEKTFEQACDAWWASQREQMREGEEEEEEEEEEGTLLDDGSENSDAQSATAATNVIFEWTNEERYATVIDVEETSLNATESESGGGVVKRYCPCELNTWKGFSEDTLKKWECAVSDREKNSSPFETSVMLTATMIIMCCVLTFRLWRQKWLSRRRELQEQEDLEASVRSENEIKFRTQDEMYEHWRSCVQPDGTKIICVEIEPGRKKKFKDDDLAIPLDANGNVVIAVVDSENSSSFSVLPPLVPPVVRARPTTVLQHHLSGGGDGGEAEEGRPGYDVEAATGTAAFPELQNHGPEHTVGRRRRRRNSSSVDRAIPAACDFSDLVYEEIEHDEQANPNDET
jgi:hypothetical protein